MTFKYKVGNLIHAARDGEVNIIAHQANCFHTMAAGIAPQLQAAFPEVYRADRQTVLADKSKTGTYSLAHSSEYNLFIYNLYGQYHWAHDHEDYGTNYHYLINALMAMRDNIREDALLAHDVPTNIGFPKIGCGLAGGDWEVVESLLKTIFKDFSVTVYVLNEKEIPSWVL